MRAAIKVLPCAANWPTFRENSSDPIPENWFRLSDFVGFQNIVRVLLGCARIVPFAAAVSHHSSVSRYLTYSFFGFFASVIGIRIRSHCSS
jgi:hypothetical protein